MVEKRHFFDVVIVGGGPAGLSAAIWCSDLGLEAVLIEGKAEMGGNLRNIFNPIGNYPGLPAANGREMCGLFEVHARKSRTIFRASAEAVRIDPRSMAVELANGEFLATRNIVLATGVRRRRAGIAGELEYVSRGILESGSRSPEAVTGKNVAIIGGGDAALENASILSKHAKRVYVIHRGNRFSARPEFVEAVQNANNVEFLMNRLVMAVTGSESVGAVELEDNESHQLEHLAVENVLFRIGVEPNSELVRNLVETDPRGYVVANNRCQTSLPTILAIGDVADSGSPTIISAAGQAATAAKTIASMRDSESQSLNRNLG